MAKNYDWDEDFDDSELDDWDHIPEKSVESKNINKEKRSKTKRSTTKDNNPSKGWRKELNLVSWNDGVPKYDLRDWDPDHQKMGKGVTLTEDEIMKLKALLESI